ncbi:MAG: hypothetical protein OWS74_07105 [Firmicutes bacterium]|nr:hypothetical protein [Bacillota bacterium]
MGKMCPRIRTEAMKNKEEKDKERNEKERNEKEEKGEEVKTTVLIKQKTYVRAKMIATVERKTLAQIINDALEYYIKANEGKLRELLDEKEP